MPPHNGTPIEWINKYWKLGAALVTAGGFIAGVGYLSAEFRTFRTETVAQLTALRTEAAERQRLNNRAHYFIAQRLLASTTDGIPGVSRPLTMEEMEIIGLLEAEINGGPQ